jgi:diguanylate cyclase (GGDEF)-like protein
MFGKLQKRRFDWGTEVSFSAIIFGLFALVMVFEFFFRNADYTYEFFIQNLDAAIIGALSLVIICLAIAHVDLKGKLRTLGRRYQSLLEQSERDVLTNVLNRETFVFEAKQALEKRGKNRFFALFLVDVDHFKQVNDTHGHPAGDRVLVFVAEKLRAHFPGARVGRLGGDEFAVLFEHSDPITAKWAHEVCSKFAAGLAGKVDIGAQRISVSASIGIALAPDHGKIWGSLVINADMALYASKKGGRDCSTLFEENMLTDIRNEKALVRELRAAMLLRHLRVAYQPIVDVNGQLIGFEALLRWRHALRVSFRRMCSSRSRSGR